MSTDKQKASICVHAGQNKTAEIASISSAVGLLVGVAGIVIGMAIHNCMKERREAAAAAAAAAAAPAPAPAAVAPAPLRLAPIETEVELADRTARSWWTSPKATQTLRCLCEAVAPGGSSTSTWMQCCCLWEQQHQREQQSLWCHLQSHQLVAIALCQLHVHLRWEPGEVFQVGRRHCEGCCRNCRRPRPRAAATAVWRSQMHIQMVKPMEQPPASTKKPTTPHTTTIATVLLWLEVVGAKAAGCAIGTTLML